MIVYLRGDKDNLSSKRRVDVVMEYDLIVIGSGSAGSVAATKCARAGWKVAMIDNKPYGGTCALRGCDPKKVLVGAAEIIADAGRMSEKGIAGHPHIIWSDLMSFKETFTAGFPEEKEEGLKRSEVDTFHGTASFVSKDEIQVGEEKLKGKKYLIATGAKPSTLPIAGNEHLIYSDDFLELQSLPERLLFIGGGYISFEFAHIAARCGAEVHIIHRGKQPLDYFEEEHVEALVRESEKAGVKVHLQTEVTSIAKEGEIYIVKGLQQGIEKFYEGNVVVHGAGRVPATEGLNLDAAGIEYSARGIHVNEFLQSHTNSNVYAAGDVAATEGMPLTPLAGKDSQIVASNLLEGNHKKPDYEVVPTVAFTIPKIASVGLTTKELYKKGIQADIRDVNMTDWYTYKRTNEGEARGKVIVAKDTNLILGAHFMSHHADEMINYFAMAMQFGIKADDLKKMTFAYPTPASDIGYLV